jgi:predicted SAM-dependent methyltransferase
MKVHLGCGKRCIPGFTHVDLADFTHIDFKYDVRTLPFLANDSAELMYACHVLEYFDRVEVADVLHEWWRVLAPGGALPCSSRY